VPWPAASAAPAPEPLSRPLTLITGDRLAVRTAADGTLEVRSDPEPGASAPELLVTRQGRDLSAIPATALPLLASGHLDPGLFDVGALVARGLTDDRTAELPVRIGTADRPLAKRSAGAFFAGLAEQARPPVVALADDEPEPPADGGYRLSVQVLDRAGQPAQDSFLIVLNADTGEVLPVPQATGEAQVYRVEAAAHLSLTALVTETAADGTQTRSFVAAPDLDVAADTTVTLDARTALPVGFTVLDPRVVPVSSQIGFTRGPAGGDPAETLTVRYSDPRGTTRLFATPAGPVEHGVFRFEAGQTLAVPPLAARLTGGGLPVTLRPVRPLEDPRLEGRRSVPLTAEPEPGSYLLLDAGDGTDPGARIQAAADAGATGIVLTGGRPPRTAGPLPVLLLNAADTSTVRTRLARGPVRLNLTGTWYSPVRYDLFETRDRVPGPPRFAAWPGQLARVDEVVRTLGAPDNGVSTRRPAPDYQPAPMPVAGGQHRTDWVSPGVAWAEDLNYGHIQDRFSGELYGWAAFWSLPPRSYRAGSRTTVTWLDEVIRPAAPGGGFGSRYGDRLLFPGTLFTDGSERPGDGRFLDEVSWRLSAGDTVVATGDQPYQWSPQVPPEPQLYTLQLDAARRNVPSWRRATETRSTFTFPSGHVEEQTPLPILTLHPHLPLDDTNSAAAGSTLTFTVDGRGPAGTVIPVAGLDLATRTAGGDWVPATVERVDEDTFRIRIDNPPATGPVDLRVTASAAGGVASTLEVDAAYGLR
jgi:hypothetical protein